MNSKYVQHIGLTAWRKKSSLLLALGLLLLIIFGLQYTKKSSGTLNIHNIPQAEKLAMTIMETIKRVKFLEANEKVSNQTYSFNNPTIENAQKEESSETDQQLGIPYVILDPKRPFIPKRRIVHFDLKGAPPLIAFYKRYFPFIKNLGATGILLEYEDMFPFEGKLKNISAKNAYTKKQVAEILQIAKDSELEVIPLVQTFGHIEFALKQLEFSSLREVPGSPQALCPSRNTSIQFIQELVNQVMALHPTANYLHIGCDEVFQMGECEVCRLELHENLFLKHVKNVATAILKTYPYLKLIIWDDMLRHMSQQAMLDVGLGKLVEPMVWVYAEDIYRFVQPIIWDKYVGVFKTVWCASAFKGAFGESVYVPDARRHLENNLRWIDVMSQQNTSFKEGLAGLVLTGWQRYDHFAILCELLPVSTPSLAISLVAATHGYFNASLKNKFLSALSCPQTNRNTPFINLDLDPFLWDKLGRCMFPGSPVFRLVYRLHSTENEAKEFVKQVKEHKGWMTSYNVRRQYSLPLRVDEIMADFPRIYHGLLSLIRGTQEAMTDIFDNYTISEWIEQRIYPFVLKMEKIQNESATLKNMDHWPVRPLVPLQDLQRLGIAVPNNP